MKFALAFVVLLAITSTISSYSINRQDEEGFIENFEEKRALTDFWNKVKTAASKLKDDIKGKVLKVLEEYKPKIVGALNNFKKVVVDGTKKVIIEVCGQIVRVIADGESATSGGICPSSIKTSEIYVEISDAQPSALSFGDIWGKVKTVVTDLGDKIDAKTKELINKYKPQIVEGLKKVHKVVVIEGKKIVIQIINDVVKVVVGGDDGASTTVVKRGISDTWNKVKTAASKLKDDIKNKVLKVLEEYKPKIVGALNNFKKVVVDGTKKVIIEVCGQIVRVIADGESATSGGICPSSIKTSEIYVEISDAQPSALSFGDIWAKVKTAVTDLGDKIDAKTKELINKYKPQIVEGLKKVHKVVVIEGKKIVIQIINDVVKVVVGGDDGASTTVVKRGISDTWNKVKTAASKLKDDIKGKVLKVLEEYKPKIVGALNNFKKVVVDGTKKVIIEVCGQIVRVIADGESATSGGICPSSIKTSEIYVEISDAQPSALSFGDIWGKVKTAVTDLGDKIDAKTKELINKYKPKIVEGLKKVHKVVVIEGKKIVIQIINDVVKVVVGGDDGVSTTNY
ncbi:uncharacterized protein LOC130662798 [Hydractinia symbiolongicarpus]|uniref:uncharacterized protein LOC130662798 n=1 Tax=Hydractinia symbiolongicarpus TaxID=13093 RepID=UPI00254FAFD1|nr:uncharacterized protein LOC130662798 [Hydractinia symbiolongicarpus]